MNYLGNATKIKSKNKTKVEASKVTPWQNSYFIFITPSVSFLELHLGNDRIMLLILFNLVGVHWKCQNITDPNMSW